MRRSWSALFVLLSIAAPVCAETITHGGTTINMDFVTVGDAGNAADTTGNPNPCGSVGYAYNIGKYEVTADQWAAVIAADANVGNAGYWSGSQPTAGTSWHEAAKFCNWLTTGQYNQGYYSINGAGEATPNALGHDAYAALHGTTYFIPTEDEWYKAAYYDGNAGVYYDYPTGSNSVPDGIDSAGDTAFDAVFSDGYNQNHPNSVTNAGVASPYGTIGQGGNVSERNETLVAGSLRGCSWYGSSEALASSYPSSSNPTDEYYSIGFRVASAVPEPGSMVLLVSGAFGLLACAWRKRAL
jgi:formylglycine-generating enzyme